MNADGSGPSDAPTFSVVIVTRNRPEALIRCIQSIAHQNLLPNEIILVLGSPESCPAELQARFPSLCFKIIESLVPNICIARNAGLRSATCELVLFIDDDARAHPGWMRAVCHALESSERVWAVGGMALDSREVPSKPEFRFGLISTAGRQIEVRDEDAPIPRGYRKTVKGCNFAVRKSRLQSIDGFDPFFAFSFDESDLMLTIQEHGGEVVQLDNAVVDHDHDVGEFRGRHQIDRDWGTEFASHTMFMLKHSVGVDRALGWGVIMMRWGKLFARSVHASVTRQVKLHSVFTIPVSALGGMIRARTEWKNRR